jgi:hypothetical protein
MSLGDEEVEGPYITPPHLYRASSCPGTDVPFVMGHNEKHSCTGARGDPVEMRFSFFFQFNLI